jgi:hypothetical protein
MIVAFGTCPKCGKSGQLFEGGCERCKLRPCPFCGKRTRVFRYSYQPNFYRIHHKCGDNAVHIRIGRCHKASVIRIWNGRKCNQ